MAVVPLYLLACLLLGGSTRAHWSNMALQLGAIAILALAALGRPRIQSGRPGRQVGYLVAALLALVLSQLVPLPPSVWSGLPGRAAVADGFTLLSQPLIWLPLSLAPYETMTSALWLLPPLAVLAGILLAGAYRDSWLAIAVVLAAFAGVLLGVLQVTSSDPLDSPWYLHAVTNNGQATGFFANSNHMGTLLVSTVPFLVALYGSRRNRTQKLHAAASKIAILGGAMLVILVGIALNDSLAGLGLGVAVLSASLFVRAPIERKQTRWGLAAAGLVGLVAISAMFANPFQNNLTGVGAERDVSSRYTSYRNSLQATRDHFPAGSGLGSFADLYPRYENPTTVDRTYINHVHNDYIEIVLETGLPGLVLLMFFLLWWVGRAVAVWRAPTIEYFGRAATIASGAILAHSVVDFPLRTSSIAVLFAMCLALMAGPRRKTHDDHVKRDDSIHERGDSSARHLSVE